VSIVTGRTEQLEIGSLEPNHTHLRLQTPTSVVKRRVHGSRPRSRQWSRLRYGAASTGSATCSLVGFAVVLTASVKAPHESWRSRCSGRRGGGSSERLQSRGSASLKPLRDRKSRIWRFRGPSTYGATSVR